MSRGGIGGIGAHIYTLSHAIAELGHDVSVIVESAPERRIEDGKLFLYAVPIRSRRQWKLGRLLPVSWLRWTFAAYRKIRELHTEKPLDAVIFPDAYGEGFRFSLSPLTHFAVLLGGPATFVQRWDGRPVPRIRARVEAWLERTPAARAPLLLCASRHFADEIVRTWSVDATRIRIIRNPLDLERFHPRVTKVPQGSKRVLFVGHLQRLKGLHELVAAIPAIAKAHPDARFQFIGNDTRTGPERLSMRSLMERELHGSGCHELVEFVPPVPQAEVVPFYQDCAVFVLPSHHDVYPNAALEAMGCGCACVVTSTTGVAELVRDSGCGIVVPPRDSTALAAAVIELLSLPAESRAAMGAKGRCIVEQACATRIVAKMWIEACRAVLTNDAVPSDAGARPAN